MLVIALAVFAYLKTLDSKQKAYEIKNNLDLPSYSGGFKLRLFTDQLDYSFISICDNTVRRSL